MLGYKAIFYKKETALSVQTQKWKKQDGDCGYNILAFVRLKMLVDSRPHTRDPGTGDLRKTYFLNICLKECLIFFFNQAHKRFFSN